MSWARREDPWNSCWEWRPAADAEIRRAYEADQIHLAAIKLDLSRLWDAVALWVTLTGLSNHAFADDAAKIAPPNFFMVPAK